MLPLAWLCVKVWWYFRTNVSVTTASVRADHCITGVFTTSSTPILREDISENTCVVLGGIFDQQLKSFWFRIGTTKRLSAQQGEGESERTDGSVLDHRNLLLFCFLYLYKRLC